jgi:hypothetical protein
MYFTQEDYRKIEAWLKSRAVKDSEFMPASPLNGKEWVAILQDGHNKKVRLKTLLDQHSMLYSDRDLINVTKTYDLDIMSFEEAIQYIPEYKRYGGLIITFMDDMGYWQYWQFVPHSKCENITEEEWNDRANWKTLENDFIRADDEDTFEFFNRKLSRTEIKFKDKKYEPLICSGLGRKYLRKRIEFSCNSGEEALCVLKQEDVSDKNTIYIIQYDYTLNGETITVAEGCVLWFQGGRLKNGTLNTNGAALWGIDSTDDCVLEDNPAIIEVSNSHRGELLTFYEPSEFKLVGEDKKFYIENDTNLYQKIDDTYFKSIYRQSPENIYDTATPVQQLKWYDGTEWIPLLDERDYNNIRKEIGDFYDLIRNDVQQVFEYYTPYLKKYDLMFQYINSSDSGNNKDKNIKWTINDLYNKIGKLDLTEINNKNTEQDTKISNLETKVSELENIKPVKSVSINKGTKNTPDENGNVDLTINFPGPPSFDTTEIEERLEALEEKDEELENKDISIEDEISNIKELESLNETFIFKLNKEIAYYTFNTGTLEKNGNYYILPGNDGKGNFFYDKSDKFKVEYRRYKPEGASWWATEFRFVISPKKVGDKTMTFVFGGLDCTFTNPYADNVLCWKDIQYYNSADKGILDEGHLPKTSVQYSGPTLIVSHFFNKKGDGAQIYKFFAHNINGQPLLKEANIVINGYWREV